MEEQASDQLQFLEGVARDHVLDRLRKAGGNEVELCLIDVDSDNPMPVACETRQ